MKKLGVASVLFLLLSWVASPQACGQTLYGGMTSNPVSPYLNLNRLGSPLGVNYYGLVQPQMQFASQLGRLQQAGGGGIQPGMTGSVDPSQFTSGHMAYFGNTSPYYRQGMMGMGMGGMGMGGMGMGRMGMGGMGMGGMGMGGMGMGGMGMGGMGMGGMGMGMGGMGMGGLGGMGVMMSNFPGRLGMQPMGFQGFGQISGGSSGLSGIRR